MPIPPNTKSIKVSTEALKNKIQKFIEKEEAAHEDRKSKYKEDLVNWQNAAITALQKKIQEIQAGNFDNCYNNRLDISLKGYRPEKPTEVPADVIGARKCLAVLEMALDDTQTIASTSDWMKYL